LRRQVLRFDLDEETAALRREHGWRDSGHSAKTLVKHHEQRIVLIAMKRGVRMKKHQAAGAVSIQVLAGHLQVTVGKSTIEVSSGDLLALDRALPHAVEALDASSFVLTLCSKPARRGVAGGARSK
jgi:quercetin dioxygenase-like cupin family protein